MAVLYREQVGQAIRRRRLALGLTQDDLADRIGVKGQTVSRWERGANLGTEENLESVAQALETTLTALMAEIKAPADGSPRTGRISQLDRIEAKLDELLEASRSREVLDAVEKIARGLADSELEPPPAPPGDEQEPPEAPAAAAG
jgi:transcriptional regulator with XRE-family HTH domain